MSSTRQFNEYHPTIIENQFLLERLIVQIALLKHELKQTWIYCRKDPVAFSVQLTRDVLRGLKRRLSEQSLASSVVAIGLVASIVLAFLYIERATQPHRKTENASVDELVLLDFTARPESPGKLRIGKDGQGRVGFNKNKGEGSGETAQLAQGGGSGGDGNPTPAQSGELPPPSTIQAAIPTAPPVNPPALPAAGIDIDPALWKDLAAPVYGDPSSISQTESKGPGDGGGIGTNTGLGIGNGFGPGYGPGRDGNTGGGPRQIGCCGSGASSDEQKRTFSGIEVDQRARLLSKPEPQYTEEARRNQTTGTVVLRVVFSNAGEVVQIRAVRTLPFGLTEKAIAAARQIKFVPAIKNGRPVSVFMQLEYNFNLY